MKMLHYINKSSYSVEKLYFPKLFSKLIHNLNYGFFDHNEEKYKKYPIQFLSVLSNWSTAKRIFNIS